MRGCHFRGQHKERWGRRTEGGRVRHSFPAQMVPFGRLRINSWLTMSGGMFLPAAGRLALSPPKGVSTHTTIENAPSLIQVEDLGCPAGPATLRPAADQPPVTRATLSFRLSSIFQI